MPIMEDNDVLDRSVILDTAGDVYTKFQLICNSCGSELSVQEVEEVPEVGIVMRIGECHECTQRAHWNGCMEGRDNGMGF